MTYKFTKMQGIGNDYIYINCLDKEPENPERLAVKLSDRHFGVGGDGVILICKSEVADVKMRMFNADGSEGKMCGNGIRCVGKYVYDNGIVDQKSVTIETLSGIKTLQIFVEGDEAKTLTVNMGKAELEPSKIPVLIGGDRVVDFPVPVDGNIYNVTCVSMGNPHCVVFADPDGINLEKIGPLFEKNELFPEGVNTEFVKVIERNRLKMRVWERGSGETLACGTGACASAVAAILNGFCGKNEEISVELLGGTLKIRVTDDAVYMTGAAEKVFEGVVNI